MDFKKAEEMLELCESKGISISQAMKMRECSSLKQLKKI